MEKGKEKIIITEKDLNNLKNFCFGISALAYIVGILFGKFLI